MSIGEHVLVTEDERKRLVSELEELVTVKRPEIARKIGRAAADGDLSENGAYHDAKEQQGHIEGRIQELEFLVRNAVVVEPQQDRVSLGTSVEIVDENGRNRQYRIVSRLSARPSEGLISDESPLGQALLNHTNGETVHYATPNGQMKSVRIVEIGS